MPTEEIKQDSNIQRIDALEQKVAELEGAVQALRDELNGHLGVPAAS